MTTDRELFEKILSCLKEREATEGKDYLIPEIEEHLSRPLRPEGGVREALESAKQLVGSIRVSWQCSQTEIHEVYRPLCEVIAEIQATTDALKPKEPSHER